MVNTPPESITHRLVDEVALRRWRRRIETSATPPWLHGEVATRMAERLAIIKRAPRTALDWWPRLGSGGEALANACKKTQIQSVDDTPASASPWWAPRGWRKRTAIADKNVPPDSADLVWCNMGLHITAEPEAIIQRWHRALTVDGFLMFSTYGPETLEDLTALYRSKGWPPPFAPFTDMHDLGDMLVRAGFADPVMDQETLTLNWADAGAMLAEIRSLGSNAHPSRHPGLRTPRWRQKLLAALTEMAAPQGRPELRFQIVYGHAFKAPPRAIVRNETSVPLEDFRAMIRSRSPSD
jgi:malonyl-CoA O-methyltransferase